MLSNNKYMSNTGDLKISWDEIKGKRVKSNDDKYLGKIKKISQIHIRIKKGVIKREQFWIPKYIADAYDGSVLWLITSEEETRNKFYQAKEPNSEQFGKDFNLFNSPYGRNITSDLRNEVRIVNEKVVGIPNKPSDSEEEYKNISQLQE